MVAAIGLGTWFRGNDGEVVGGRYGIFRASDFLLGVRRNLGCSFEWVSGQGDAAFFDFKDDLAQCFAGEFYFEDRFNFASQGGAVVGTPFGDPFGPRSGDVVVDGVRALWVDATA